MPAAWAIRRAKLLFLIDTTYATRKGKGGYAALDKAVWGLSKYKYTLKLDFRKYYDSIDHAILKSLLRRKFKDGYPWPVAS